MAWALAEGDAVKRLRFEVLRDESGMWAFVSAASLPKKVVHLGKRKRDVVQYASDDLNFIWAEWCIRSELTIKGRDGSIQDTRTYGDDPRRTRG